MKSISSEVELAVKKSPFIAEALRDGLLNISAFARLIIPDLQKALGKEVKLTTVVMAIQRMDFGHILTESKKLRSLFKKIKDIIVRGHLRVYTLQQSPSLIKNLSQLLGKLGHRKDVLCTFSQGIAECTVILSKSEASKFEKIFCHETILEVEDDLTAFTLILPDNNRALSGVYYTILKELAWAGINVIEVVSTSNEFSIVVKDKDSGLCFEVLREIGR